MARLSETATGISGKFNFICFGSSPQSVTLVSSSNNKKPVPFVCIPCLKRPIQCNPATNELNIRCEVIGSSTVKLPTANYRKSKFHRLNDPGKTMPDRD